MSRFVDDLQPEQVEVPPPMSGYHGLVVIIPTRNRSDLAKRAIFSTLQASRQDQVHVLVSDNSTDDSEIEALGEFCRDLGDDRVRYIRPPEPMNMANHWEWAFQQALDRYDDSHLTVLPDRRIYVRGGLHALCNIARDHADTVIVSDVDAILDHESPIRVGSKQGSGRLLEVQTETMLKGNSHATWELVQLVPTPMIAIIPRRLFSQVRERFGNYCLSLAPDYCFGYRVLDIEESLFIYDKSTTIMLGMGRSSGFSFMRGVTTKDKLDFIATNGGSDFSYWATPIPEILTGFNAIYHEYNFVRSQSRSGRIPELDKQSYFKFLYFEITTYFNNDNLKNDYIDLLSKHGFQVPTPPPAPAPGPVADQLHSREPLFQRIRNSRSREPDKSLWMFLSGKLAARADWTLKQTFRRLQRSNLTTPLHWGLYKLAGVGLPQWLNDRGFSSLDEAIEFHQGMNYKPSHSLEQILERESQPCYSGRS